MDSREVSELMLEADFLWREIQVGDQVQIEESISEQGCELLSPGRHYMVLMKQQSETGLQSFVTESNIEGCLATVYPHNICNYEIGPNYTLS